MHVAFTMSIVSAREWRVTFSRFPVIRFCTIAYKCSNTLFDLKHKYSSPSRFRSGIYFNKIEWELVSAMPLSKLKSSPAKRVSLLTKSCSSCSLKACTAATKLHTNTLQLYANFMNESAFSNKGTMVAMLSRHFTSMSKW